MTVRLLQITLFHSYFSSGLFESCWLTPDPFTAAFLSRYQLFMRDESGIFGLYSDNSNPDVAGLVRYLNGKLAGAPLRFLLGNDESQFYRMTNLPFDYVGQIGLSSAAGAPGPAPDRAPPGPVRRELVAAMGPRVVNQPGVIGVFSVYLDDWLAIGATDVCYETHFQARTLHWQYYLINRSQIKLNNPVIRNQQKAYFEGPVPLVLSTGEKALSFSSGEMEFPLRQVPDGLFSLIDNLQSSLHANAPPIERCLINGLPTPDGENIKARRVGDGFYTFGEMYVYL